MFSVSTRIFLAISLMLLLFLGAAFFTIYRIKASREGLQRVSEHLLPLYTLATRLDSEKSDMSRSVERLLTLNNAQVQADMLQVNQNYFTSRLQKILDASRKRLTNLDSHPEAMHGSFVSNLRSRYDAIEKQLARYMELLRELGELLKNAPGSIAGSGPESPAGEAPAVKPLETVHELKAAQTRFKTQSQKTDSEIQLLILGLEKEIQKTNANLLRSEHETQLFALILFCVILIVGVLVLFRVHRNLSPLRELTQAVKRVSGGRFDETVLVRGGGEIAELGNEFNRMALSLKSRDDALSKQNQRLLLSERLAAIGKLSTQITHEIRNPLNSMGLNLESLAEALTDFAQKNPSSMGPSQQMLGLISAIQKEIDRLTEITGNYLGYAKLPQVQPQLQPLLPVLKNLSAFVQEAFSKKQVTLRSQFQIEENLRAAIDANSLHQALLNLLLNALDATQKGDTVSFFAELDQRSQEIVLGIADTGKGMTPEQKEHIFEPFFSTKPSGTGLGLSITQQIVLAHQGNIVCESELQKGTKFVVRLPHSA